jgi:formylglycine-generating enzyme required for sulfatase activity
LPVLIGIAAGVLLLVGIGYGFYRYTRTAPAAKQAQNNQSNPDLQNFVLVPAGTFVMGRNDVSANNQAWPAHSVSVREFYMQKTEVTNADYAEFVQSENYDPPEGWSGKNPPAGQEQWPVSGVSEEDATAFAGWRSRREKVIYRLPSEKEWEYAARSGSREYLYPWGNTWFEDRANLGTGSGTAIDRPKPVGSYPQGATESGILDMIGNVWEWTSSDASFYPGNQSQVPSKERGWFVVRGGSHQSLYGDAPKDRGGRELPATFRQWIPKETKSPTVGFRLARDTP